MEDILSSRVRYVNDDSSNRRCGTELDNVSIIGINIPTLIKLIKTVSQRTKTCISNHEYRANLS